MKLSKFASITFLIVVISAIFWIAAINNSTDIMLWCAFISSVIAAVMLIILIISAIVKLIKKKNEKSKADVNTVFTITMTLITIATVAYALYDIHTDFGFMAGLIGGLILMFVVPAESVVIIISVITLIIRKRKAKETDKKQ